MNLQEDHFWYSLSHMCTHAMRKRELLRRKHNGMRLVVALCIESINRNLMRSANETLGTGKCVTNTRATN